MRAYYRVYHVYIFYLDYIFSERGLNDIEQLPYSKRESFTSNKIIITRRLQGRSLRLPTRSKSTQTGHLYTTAQAGTDPRHFRMLVKISWSQSGEGVLISKYGIEIEHMKQKELLFTQAIPRFFSLCRRRL